MNSNGVNKNINFSQKLFKTSNCWGENWKLLCAADQKSILIGISSVLVIGDPVSNPD